MQELTGAIRSLVNGKALGPDGVSVELSKITLNGDPALRRRLLNIVVCVWRGARDHSSGGKMSSSWYSIKRRIEQNAATTGHLAGSARRQDTAEDHRLPPQRVLRAHGDPAGGTEWFTTESDLSSGSQIRSTTGDSLKHTMYCPRCGWIRFEFGP